MESYSSPTRMSRYYSQSYAPLDDPDWNPDASHSAAASHENLHDTLRDSSHSYEPYRSYATHADDAPLNESLPSAYLDTKYPQKGVRGGLKRVRFQGKKWFAWSEWSGRKKIVVVSTIIALLIIIAIAVAVPIIESGSSFSYTQSFAKVTNQAAFQDGGATKEVQNHDGIGSGEDKYTFYSGDVSNFPTEDKWVSFQNMWTNNRPTIEGGCSTLGEGADDTPEEIGFIFDAIKNRSEVSFVDHRFILAVILQETQGCVHAGETKSASGVTNPGLMQSHNGHSFNEDNPQLSILQMVQDGTQGTEDGAGLVQGLNLYGNVYQAARYYNSGVVGKDLSKTQFGTPCYVSDIANRLTGWRTAPNTCPGE